MPWKKREPMEERMEFAVRAMRTLNFRALCQEYGISAKTGYKWKERFWRKGLAGMEEESRRPKSHSEQLPEEDVCEIVRLKLAHLSWGPRKIRELYLRRHGEVASESTFKRVFKGWWRSGDKRCEPLTVRDEYSRYVLEVRAVEDARSETVRKSFEQLFAAQGLPEAIRSDNGAPFASKHGLWGLSRLSAWWVALGIDLERGRPGHPQDNGAHERMHKDISRELEAMGQCDQQALDLWRQIFNYERPHDALGLRCPGEVYIASAPKYEGTPEDLDYPQMCSRRVGHDGTIKLEGNGLFLSTSLAGWSVRLKPITSDLLEVWFGRLALGQVDLATSNFIRRISARIKLQMNTKSVNNDRHSVTDVLTQKCYRCSDCASSTLLFGLCLLVSDLRLLISDLRPRLSLSRHSLVRSGCPLLSTGSDYEHEHEHEFVIRPSSFSWPITFHQSLITRE
jgi:putative transposase